MTLLNPFANTFKVSSLLCLRAIDFHPKFLGLTGTYNQIKRVAKNYRLYFSAPPLAVDDDTDDYLVDHSIFFYLVDPDGKYIAHYGRTDTAEEVTAKIIETIKNRRAGRS